MRDSKKDKNRKKRISLESNNEDVKKLNDDAIRSCWLKAYGGRVTKKGPGNDYR